MRKVTEEEKDKIISMFNNGAKVNEIINETGFCRSTINKQLASVGLSPGDRRHKNSCIGFFESLSLEEQEDILAKYKNGQINDILTMYPKLTKSFLYTYMSNRGVDNEIYFWTKDEEQLLIDNYGKSYEEISKIMNYRHSPRAISTKAIKMNLTESRQWTEDEIEIMNQYYSKLSSDELRKLLPNRTPNAITLMGAKLGIPSYLTLTQKYSEDEIQFVKDNYTKLTDEEIAVKLGRKPHNIRDLRGRLRLLRLNKDYSHYESLTKFFRGHLSTWKDESMKVCNYACVLTGSKQFVIHHVHGFNLILSNVYEILEDRELLKSNIICDYTKEELDILLQYFLEIHSSYPLGVCVRKDIHELFHRIYGAGGNNVEQWNTFVQRFKSHEFDEILVK